MRVISAAGHVSGAARDDEEVAAIREAGGDGARLSFQPFGCGVADFGSELVEVLEP